MEILYSTTEEIVSENVFSLGSFLVLSTTWGGRDSDFSQNWSIEKDMSSILKLFGGQRFCMRRIDLSLMVTSAFVM
jgi:hypothetical protein